MRRSSRKGSSSGFNRGPRESRMSTMLKEYEESFDAGYSDDESGVIGGSMLYNLHNEDNETQDQTNPQYVERRLFTPI